ncbi:carboxymuconolactone decarboxylase family protein [Gemmatimonas sp.]|uniref:carboxymuconolactone decarboxylase family protein n=1 Tax=Gemmatimonas sp. TaxID=1962908 RepID=UPI00286E249D|nr:carboxymuconolactone decarboxylase family protein [Gemmatimonas sp.]
MTPYDGEPRMGEAGARTHDTVGVGSMTARGHVSVTLDALDAETAALVRLAAVLAGGSEAEVRAELSGVNDVVNPIWVEEVILQTYLFAGFPRALNAARDWRRISGRLAPSPADDREAEELDFVARGEATCATVYGEFYDRLRVNIRGLHPALDRWMITEGYGKVLGRPLLDLARRELCVVAACAIARQDRQLHSHLHGALNAGASAGVVTAALRVVSPLISDDDMRRYLGLWARVQGK